MLTRALTHPRRGHPRRGTHIDDKERETETRRKHDGNTKCTAVRKIAAQLGEQAYLREKHGIAKKGNLGQD